MANQNLEQNVLSDDTVALEAPETQVTTPPAKPKRKRAPKAQVTTPTTEDTVVEPTPVKATKAKSDKPKSAPRPKGLTLGQKVALATGTVAIALMALSVTHLTESIALLTGSHWALAGLLAIGIDAGMLCAEAAMLLSQDKEARRWATGYVWVSGAASMLLNAYAFALHAPQGMAWAAVMLGVLIPGLVLVLGKVGGKLWLEATKAPKA